MPLDLRCERKRERMTIETICPTDSTPLVAETATSFRCPLCSRLYPERDGVLKFVARNDEFYEGAYQAQVSFLPRSERPWHAWPLWLISSGYLWMVRRFVPARGLVVELGCGGGVKYFGRRYRMVGCDLSSSSLERLNGIYERLLQVDAAEKLPLQDGTVDAVVSSFFWEHIPPGVKPRILAECMRILKPGGRLIFLYDVETDNPMIGHYKRRDPVLYRRLFLEGDGHLGYQSSSDNLRLFRSAGLSILAHRGIEKSWVQSGCVYEKLTAFGGVGRPIFRFARILDRAPFFYLYTAVVRIVDALFGPLLPDRWARMVVTVCSKDGIATGEE